MGISDQYPGLFHNLCFLLNVKTRGSCRQPGTQAFLNHAVGQYRGRGGAFARHFTGAGTSSRSN